MLLRSAFIETHVLAEQPDRRERLQLRVLLLGLEGVVGKVARRTRAPQAGVVTQSFNSITTDT